MRDSKSSHGGGAGEVFLVFLRLGCTSFGGPAAHLGYFEREFVERRRWLTGEQFGELVALSQSLPGPGSSQVGFAIGMVRAGLRGALAAWLGFTLPSAALMLAFALERKRFSGLSGANVLHGLQLVAVAVVAAAVLSMRRLLAPDILRMGLALAAMVVCLWVSATLSALGVIAGSAVAGVLWLRRPPDGREASVPFAGSRRVGLVAGACFAVLLGVSLAWPVTRPDGAGLWAGFFQAGALVFGGGHVVLPMLDRAVIARGWVSRDVFLSGYGAAQAVPGPLFTFAAFLGAVAAGVSHPVLGGVIALLSIFAPGLLLMTAALPFWGELRSRVAVAAALRGVNAGVVGILAAALWRPIGVSAVHSWADMAVAAGAFVALTALRLAPWMVVTAVGVIYGVAGLIR